MGSLAGAAHLLNDNTGDLRSVQCERKSHVEFKGKSWFDFDFQYESEHWKVWPSDPLDFWVAKLEVSEKLPQYVAPPGPNFTKYVAPIHKVYLISVKTP